MEWPDKTTFPGFIGYSFSEVHSPREGTGKLVRRLSYWNYEENTFDAELFRMKYKAEDLERPSNAAPELTAGIGKHFTQHRYFRADHRRKVFVFLGANDCPDETTAPVGSFFSYKDKPEVQEGGWTWRSVGHAFLQFVLNDKNTVLRSIDYYKFRQEDSSAALDPIASMSFYLAQDQSCFQPHVLAADILPPPDLAGKIENWRTFFGNQAQYLNANVVQQRTVNYCARISTVDSIDPSKETFSGEIQIELEWGLTKTDLVEYLAATDLDTWRPAWSELRVQNGSGKPIKYDSGPIVPFVPDNGKTAQLVVARQTILIRGEYFNDFELHSYPYDSQVLSVSLSAAHSTEDDAKFVQRDHAEMSRVQNSEWRPVERHGQFEFLPTHQHGQHGTSGRYCLDVSTVVMREYAIHRYRVIFPMAMFCLLSIGAFTLDPNEYVGDRFNVVITLLLTATAYSLTIAEKLPTLGYLTWLDKYILASFFFIMAVAVAIIFLNYTDETARTTDDTTAVVALGLWGLLQALMYATTVRASRQQRHVRRSQESAANARAIPRRVFSIGNPASSI